MVKETTSSSGYNLRSRGPAADHTRPMDEDDHHWYVTADEPQVSSSDPYHAPMYSGHIDQHHSRPDPHWFEHLRGDIKSILLLLGLYLLQGIPLGLTAGIPLILQSRHVSYQQQAVFSFAYWPFSLKLLWAPIVDSIYSRRIGRRKSWLVPTQYLIALFMYILSHHVTYVLGDDSDSSAPDVVYLTGVFFALNSLAATQDIAVDGWALTMLSERNLGYASTCNAVGQTAGWFIGNVVFLALESADFCNRYLRSEPQPTGLVTLAGFVWFWSIVYAVATTLVLLLKREKSGSSNSNSLVDNTKDAPVSEEDMGVAETYRLVGKVFFLKPVLLICAIHMTSRMGFAAADAITGLKLVELGVPKEKLALLAIPMIPVQILLPVYLGRFTTGRRPLSVYLKAYPVRLVFGLVFMAVIYWTPSFKNSADQTFPLSFYAMIVGIYAFHQVAVYSMFVASMAFAAKVSDPLVGGTYMTLFNTVSNLGGNWPNTVVLSTVDYLTSHECSVDVAAGALVNAKACGHCPEHLCLTTVDGYAILSIVCVVIGAVWFLLMRRRIESLHHVDKRQWNAR